MLCEECAPGKADSDSTASTPCVDCNPGSYADEGVISCSECRSGKFDHDSDPGTPCEDCSAGQVSPSNR